jgi:hypothetical protein
MLQFGARMSLKSHVSKTVFSEWCYWAGVEPLRGRACSEVVGHWGVSFEGTVGHCHPFCFATSHGCSLPTALQKGDQPVLDWNFQNKPFCFVS